MRGGTDSPVLQKHGAEMERLMSGEKNEGELKRCPAAPDHLLLLPFYPPGLSERLSCPPYKRRTSISLSLLHLKCTLCKEKARFGFVTASLKLPVGVKHYIAVSTIGLSFSTTLSSCE